MPSSLVSSSCLDRHVKLAFPQQQAFSFSDVTYKSWAACGLGYMNLLDWSDGVDYWSGRSNMHIISKGSLSWLLTTVQWEISNFRGFACQPEFSRVRDLSRHVRTYMTYSIQNFLIFTAADLIHENGESLHQAKISRYMVWGCGTSSSQRVSRPSMISIPTLFQLHTDFRAINF